MLQLVRTKELLLRTQATSSLLHFKDVLTCVLFYTEFLLRAAARKPDTQPATPLYTDNLKTKHQIRQAATTCIIFSSS
jgi:hypothetical protein